MKEPELDNRHRDEDGEISRKHGNTLVRTLRTIYGAGFARELDDAAKLSDVLAKLDEMSLSKLVRDHSVGMLAAKITAATSTTAPHLHNALPRPR